jgi:putative redox protein
VAAPSKSPATTACGRGAPWSFEFVIVLSFQILTGLIERAQLMQAVNMCPVGRTLGLSADICTKDNVSVGPGGKL